MSETPDYRDTVFLPKTDFPMKAGLAAEGAGHPRALGAGQALRAAPQRPPGARALHPPRRPALRQWRHPYGPCDEQDPQGHRRPLAVSARQGRALRARLGLPRPADRMEGRGGISQEEARQGRGAQGPVPRRMPRLCREMGGGSVRAVPAARRPGRMGRSLSHDEARGRGEDRRGIAEIRRDRPALSRRQAGHVVAGREDRAGRGRGRI